MGWIKRKCQHSAPVSPMTLMDKQYGWWMDGLPFEVFHVWWFASSSCVDALEYHFQLLMHLHNAFSQKIRLFVFNHHLAAQVARYTRVCYKTHQPVCCSEMFWQQKSKRHLLSTRERRYVIEIRHIVVWVYATIKKSKLVTLLTLSYSDMDNSITQTAMSSYGTIFKILTKNVRDMIFKTRAVLYRTNIPYVCISLHVSFILSVHYVLLL